MNGEQLEPEVAEAARREVEEMKRLREFDDGKKKQMVKFRLTTGEDSNAVQREKFGVVRIKVVVTREELKQILNCDESDLKQSSVEKLITAMKLRGRRIYEVRTNDNGDSNSSWRPALESIPEDP